MTTPVDPAVQKITDSTDRATAHLDTAHVLTEKSADQHDGWLSAQKTAKKSLEVIGEQAAKIPDPVADGVADMQRYATAQLVGLAIEGTGESVVRMTRAFSQGRPHEGGAEILRMVGSAANLLVFAQGFFEKGAAVSKWLGPIGTIVGEIFSIGVAVLQGYGPQEKSIGEELKEALAEYQGKDNLDRLDGLLDSYALGFANLLGHKPNSLSWDKANKYGNLTNPTEVVFLGAADNYLRRESDTDIWEEVFEAYVYARSQWLKNVMLALTRIRKFDADGPTDDMLAASKVLREILEQCETFLDDFTPLAVEHGTRWFIGSNQSLYRTTHGEDNWLGEWDTKALRLAVAGDWERVWHLGTDHGLYTGKGKDWRRLPGVRADALAVTTAEKGSFHVHTLDGGKLRYLRWQEQGEPPADAASPFTGTGPTQLLRELSVTAHEFYALDIEDGLWIWTDKGARRLPGPGGEVKPRFVSATADYVYLAGGATLWRTPTARLPKGETDDQEVTWETVKAPGTALKLPARWAYADLYACGDGAVLTIIDQKIYRLSDGGAKGEWRRVDNNTARRIVKAPVRGSDLFAALRTTVSTFRETVEELEVPPVTEER